MAEQAGASGDAERGPQGRASTSERRDSRRVSRVSYKESYSNLDEYGKLVKYASTYREGARGDESQGEEEMKRVWYAPWKKRKVFVKHVDQQQGQFPEEWLLTDIRQGLSESEISVRRRRSGWNELVSEKENPIAKVLSYFRGPILYGTSSNPWLHRQTGTQVGLTWTQ